MANNFRESNKSSFLMIFGIISLVLGFGAIKQNVPEVKAVDEIYCTTDVAGDYTSDCESNAENCTLCSGYTSTCTVNSNNTSVESSLLPMTATGSCSSESLSFPKTRKCTVGGCPNNNSAITSGVGLGLQNGDPCTVRVLSGTTVQSANGIWDASEYKCISNPCLGNKETYICGTTTSISVSGSFCNGTGDGQFETACGSGVDAGCDEKIEGDNCDAGDPNKKCDSVGKCVAASICTAGAPTLAITPPFYSGPAIVKTFTVKVTRHDSSVCAPKSVSGTVSCSGSSPDYDTFTTPILNYGDTDTAGRDINVTITSTGSCIFAASSPDNPALTGSATAAINVSASSPAPSAPPSPAPSNPPSPAPSTSPAPSVPPSPAPSIPPVSGCSGPGMYANPLTYCKIEYLIDAAINWILGLASGIIILILILGGITYVTSAGDEDRIKTAKNTILYAIIGLVLILLAYTMINEMKVILNIIP